MFKIINLKDMGAEINTCCELITDEEIIKNYLESQLALKPIPKMESDLNSTYDLTKSDILDFLDYIEKGYKYYW